MPVVFISHGAGNVFSKNLDNQLQLTSLTKAIIAVAAIASERDIYIYIINKNQFVAAGVGQWSTMLLQT